MHVADDGTTTMVGEFELVLRADAGATSWRVLNKGEHSLFGLTVGDFWWGVLAALIIAVINGIFGIILRPQRQRRRD